MVLCLTLIFNFPSNSIYVDPFLANNSAFWSFHNQLHHTKNSSSLSSSQTLATMELLEILKKYQNNGLSTITNADIFWKIVKINIVRLLYLPRLPFQRSKKIHFHLIAVFCFFHSVFNV